MSKPSRKARITRRRLRQMAAWYSRPPVHCNPEISEDDERRERDLQRRAEAEAKAISRRIRT